jgi:hypothetical protein
VDTRPTGPTPRLENEPTYYLTPDPITAQPDSTTQTTAASGVQDSADAAVNVEGLTLAMENFTTVSGVQHSAGSAVSDVPETEVPSSMTEVEIETEIKMETKDELTPKFRADLQAKAEAALEAEIKEEAKMKIEREASAWLDASSGAALVVGYASSSTATVVPATPPGPLAWAAAVVVALDANAGSGIPDTVEIDAESGVRHSASAAA